MLPTGRNRKRKRKGTLNKVRFFITSNLNHILIRKDGLSPIFSRVKPRLSGASVFVPPRAALTVEASLVLPLFLFCMIAALQYCRVLETSVRIAGGLCDTGKTLATAAYLYEYPEDGERTAGIAAGVLSGVWARQDVLKTAGDTGCISGVSMALSSFLQGDEMIDLVMTYQIRSPMQIVKLPSVFFLQRACVRAWTGRLPPGNQTGTKETSQEKDTVYVTATGSVYHEDEECTHLKLSIREVDGGALESLRNNGGGKYHPCEKCGGGDTGGCVYITSEGNRYHASLSCSGLKRTVREITREEAGHMRACSKCGGK